MDKPTKTIIKVDKDYNIIKKEVINKKPLSNEVIDIIIPILKRWCKVGKPLVLYLTLLKILKTFWLVPLVLIVRLAVFVIEERG